MDRDSRESEECYPQAPSQEEWEAMTPEERARVVAALPGVVTYEEMAMPEGDRHQKGKKRALEVLEEYFREKKREAYVGSELPVYYPSPASRFAPDVLVVLDVEPHEREKWIVSDERKGLDWVMEVHVGGDRKKDAQRNVANYAQLGIAEYFIHDRAKERLEGYALPTPKAKEYERLEPEGGRYVSKVLGLTLQVVEGKLCFWEAERRLLDQAELREQLRKHTAKVERRADMEAKRRQEEVKRRKAEAKRRKEEVKRRKEEVKRRKGETKRRQEETKRRQEETKRRQEEVKRRKEEVKRRKEAERRAAAEARQRQEEVARREEAEKRAAVEARQRQEEEARRQEAERQAEVARQRLAELQALLEQLG